MKILLNDFIKFLEFFNSLNELDKEELNKEKDNLIERLKELKTNEIDTGYFTIDYLLDGDNTKINKLFYKLVSLLYSISNTNDETNMSLLQPNNPNNFKYLFNNFINFMAELDELKNNNIKELINNQIKINTDKDYITKIKNSIDNFIPIVYNSIDEIILDDKSKEKKYDIREKYLTSAELAEIINLTKPAITTLRKKGYFSNTIQDAKKTKTQIPFRDIDNFCKEKTKYLKAWNDYKNNL